MFVHKDLTHSQSARCCSQEPLAPVPDKPHDPAAWCVQLTKKVVEEAGQKAILLPGGLQDEEHIK